MHTHTSAGQLKIKRGYFSLFVFLFVLTSSFGKPNKPIIQKIVTTAHHIKIINGMIIKTKRHGLFYGWAANSIKVFDKKGRLIKESDIMVDDKIYKTTLYIYNPKGLLKKTITRSGTNTRGGWSFQYTYDKKNRLIKVKSSGKYYSTYKYNNKSQRISEHFYNGNGTLVHKFSNTYDTKGQKKSRLKLQASDGLTWLTTYRYNKQGQLIQKHDKRTDMKHGSKTTYKFDAKSNIIEERLTNDGSNTSDLRIFKFTFNQYGHTIRKIIFVNSKPHSMEERVISYFK